MGTHEDCGLADVGVWVDVVGACLGIWWSFELGSSGIFCQG